VEILPESSMRIVVEKAGSDYSVQCTAEVKSQDSKSVMRTVRSRMRRAEKDGMTRIQILPLPDINP